MKASVCMASFNRDPAVLRQVLESVCSQSPPFEFEVIVADDGSEYGAPDVCNDFPVKYHRIERPAVPQNSSVGHNAAYRRATGDIIIAQSDDVVHQQDDSIEVLCRQLEECPRSVVFATVYGCNENGTPDSVYCGVWDDAFVIRRPSLKCRRAPYFFLGAIRRKDLYAVGCDDEDFNRSGGQAYEDRWLGHCLLDGLGLAPVYTDKVLAYHIWHATRVDKRKKHINRTVYLDKLAEAERTGIWCASGGPWEMNNA